MQTILAQFNQSLKHNLSEQRPILFAPFVLSIGILIGLDYLILIETIILAFSCAAILVFAIAGYFLFLRSNANWLMLLLNSIMFCLILTIGAFLFVFKAQKVSAPIIHEKGLYQKIKGEIININRAASGKWRVLIRPISINNISQAELPKYVRLNIDEIDSQIIGNIIECDGFLAPPSGAVLPGEYEFALKAWFQGLGAVGSCNGRVNILSPRKIGLSAGFQNTLTKWRNAAAFNITKGEIGGGKGLLAALMTGNRSYISLSETEALGVSGLGHIISVSGMHVSLLAAILFFPLRKILVCIPNLALYFDTRKIAAIFTLGALTLYTFLTGGEAPTLRALIMAYVAFVGILLDRRAISMRALAISALALLIIFPEQAIDPGFQMSFLATMALVALWEWFETHKDARPKTLLEKILFWPIAAGSTSLVAGIATIPVSLYNFSTINSYGLVANLLAAPISDFIIGPFAVIGALFSPFGLGDLFLGISAWGCDLVLKIGAYFALLPQFSPEFGEFGGVSAALMIFAIVWFCIFHGIIRSLSVLPFSIGLLLWVVSPMPILYISANGKAVLRPASSGNEAKICFARGAGFDARLLLNSISLNKIDKAKLEAQSQKRANQCAINGGDFEAHFVNRIANKNLEQEAALLTLTFNGKTQWISDNAPVGAKLYRINGMPLLKIGELRPAPWRRKQTISTNSGDKAIQEPLEP